MEGGIGTPLAGKIVVAAVFDGGVAVEEGGQNGSCVMHMLKSLALRPVWVFVFVYTSDLFLH